MKIIYLFLLILISSVLQATTYQIADQAAKDAFDFSSLVAGDQVLFAKGQTFYGSITISDSGTLANPITVGAYGTGANPIITGFTTVSAWTNLGSNIWESTSAVSTLSTCNMVTINDVNTAMGRYPNANDTWGGYLRFQSHVDKTSITSNELNGTWVGAEIRVRCSSWSFGKSIITSQNGGTLNFNALDSYTPTDGYGFFIQNDVRTLDQQNEWYYNPLTKKLRIYSTTQPTNVKVASVDNLLTINGDFITVDGISLSGANGIVLYNASTTVDHITIQNCSILYAGNATIQFRCANFDVQNNEIAYANNKGVAIDYSSNVIFKNNNVHDISVFQGMGKSGNGTFSGLNGYGQLNVLIESNTFTNFGGAAIEGYGDSITIKNNIVDTFGFVIDDLGGIYTFVGLAPNIPFTMVRIEGNIVLNGIGAINGTYFVAGQEQAMGIYLDDNSSNVEVLNNTVANCAAYGFYFHNTNNINVHDNTVFNSGRGQVLMKDDGLGGVIYNNTLTNNQFISKTATQKVLYCRSSDNNISTFGTFSANYYARPIDDNLTVTVDQPSAVNTYKTFAQWQTFSGQDANSFKSPYTVTSPDHLYLAYNTTGETASVPLPAAYKEIDGTTHTTGFISLPAYGSEVLFYTGDIVSGGDDPPIITTFIIPITSNTLNITITALTATDDIGITGYALTESATQPLAGSDIWSATAPTSYTFTSYGQKTLHAWVKDVSNNISYSFSDIVIIPSPDISTGKNLTRNTRTGIIYNRNNIR